MIDLLAPDADAQWAAQRAEIAAERLVTVRAAIARIEAGRARAVAETPAGLELDAWLAPVDEDLARLRAELATSSRAS